RTYAHFQFERKTLQETHATLLAYLIHIVRMESSGEESLVVNLPHGQSSESQSRPVRVECRTIRGQNDDGLANGIGDRAQFLLILPQLLFGASAMIDVAIDPIPADEVALLISNRGSRDLKPAILAIEAPKTHLCRGALAGVLESAPPGFELLDIILM